MIRNILVPATGNDSDATCFATALAAARIFSAHIDALHVRFDPVDVAVAMSSDGAGGALLEGIIDGLNREADDRERKARAAFTAFCARADLMLGGVPSSSTVRASADWHVETGREGAWTTAYGMTADLIVAGRGTPGDDAAARSLLETLLLETGRPLLIPGNGTGGTDGFDRVAVAWKPTPQASRAVSYALPFLAAAKDVAVITVEEEEGRRDEVDRLVGYLGWHGIKPQVQRLSPSPLGGAETLLAVSAETRLLVMGGYGHSRLREWVFGGFTQRVLADAPMPVLMAH